MKIWKQLMKEGIKKTLLMPKNMIAYISRRCRTRSKILNFKALTIKTIILKYPSK